MTQLSTQIPDEDERREARSLFIEWLIAQLAVWLQIAAICWISLLPAPAGIAWPLSGQDILWWLSWPVMIGATIVLAVLGYRRREIQFSFVMSVILWILVLLPALF